MRRFGVAFENSADMNANNNILVGTPAGCFHEMGALALATAMRKSGLGVIYLGSNIPPRSWVDAVSRNKASGVVISVVMPQDAENAQLCINEIKNKFPEIHVAVGGAAAALTERADLLLKGNIESSRKTLTDFYKR